MPIKMDKVFYTYSAKTPFQTEALTDINLEIKDKSFTAFVGATGSGKSTIVQHLNALLVPTQGEVIVDGFHIGPNKRKNKNIHELRKHIGLVFQFPEYQLFEETVEKDVAFGPKNFKVEEKQAIEKAHEALKAVGLDETYYKRSPFELSGGERRRVAIAGILAIEPDILVLDEPTAGLDPIGANAVMDLFKQMNDKGITIVLVTHDMDLVLKYCDEVFVVDKGQIQAHGEPSEVFATLDSDSSIEVPVLFSLCRRLNENGLNIDYKSMKNVDDFVDIIAKKVGEKK